MGVTVGIQVFHPVQRKHSGAVSAAHLADVVPQIFIAHHPGQHLAVAAALHGPHLHIVVHAAVNDERFVHRRGQRFGVGFCRGAVSGGKGAFRQQGAQLCKCFVAAVQADGQRRILQHFGAQGVQLFAQSRPVAPLLHAAQELVIAHAAAPLGDSALCVIMRSGADSGIGVALLDELLLHVQLLLAQHPGKGCFRRRTGQSGVIQPLAAQLHGLVQTAFQQAQAQA